MKRSCCCSWTACNADISAPAASRAFSASSKACRGARRSCRTASRWPSLSAAGSPSARFGCERPTPICWARARTARTYGGSPLACAVALKILDVIQREKLATTRGRSGLFLKTGLQQLAQKYPSVIQTVRGLGLMLGIELAPEYFQPARRQQQNAGGPFRESAPCRRAAGHSGRRANHAFPAAAQPAAGRGRGRAED